MNPFQQGVHPIQLFCGIQQIQSFLSLSMHKKRGKSVYFSKLAGHAVSISTGVSTWCDFVCECELCSFTRKPSHFFFYSTTSVVKSWSASVMEPPMGVTYLRKYVTQQTPEVCQKEMVYCTVVSLWVSLCYTQTSNSSTSIAVITSLNVSFKVKVYNVPNGGH